MFGVSDLVVMEQERPYQARPKRAHNYMGAFAVPYRAETISELYLQSRGRFS